jgi:hypothetical protein
VSAGAAPEVPLKDFIFIAGAVATLACNGCMSHYSGGPSYARVTPPTGYAAVHVYRPKKGWGALQMIEASQPGRVAVLPSGAYATFVVPAGHVTMKSAINTWSQMIAVYAPGAVSGTAISSKTKVTETPVSFDVSSRGVYFIRTEFTSFEEAPSATLVDASTGEGDISGLHLAAGGRGRYPVTPWVDAAPTPVASDAPK